MEKLQSLYLDLKKAFKRLKETTNWPETLVHQDATIQRFEFTFELSWKLMNLILRENGIETYGPRNTFREAAKLGLIGDLEVWFDFLKNRNLTVHTYHEKVARQVYKKSKEFVFFVRELIKKAKDYVG